MITAGNSLTKRHRAAFAGGLAVVLVACVLGARSAHAEGSVEDRLARIERLLNNNTLLKMLDELRAVRDEVRNLRGDMELQAYNTEQLKTQAKQRYLDLDERLQRLESGLAGAVPPADTGVVAGEGADLFGNQQAAVGGGDPAVEEQAYQSAFERLKAGRYADAAAGFEAYQRDYPNGRFSANAQYWLGETHYVERRYAKALEVFNNLSAMYPDSDKAPDASLKSGYILLEQGKRAEARRVLDNVANQYPNTRAAELARDRLAQLGN